MGTRTFKTVTVYRNVKDNIGQKFNVETDIGFHDGFGCYALDVATNKGTKLVVSTRRRGPYFFFNPFDQEEEIVPA